MTTKGDQAKVLENWIRENGPLTAGRIAKDLGLELRDVNAVVADLARQDRIRRDGAHLWHYCDHGDRPPEDDEGEPVQSPEPDQVPKFTEPADVNRAWTPGALTDTHGFIAGPSDDGAEPMLAEALLVIAPGQVASILRRERVLHGHVDCGIDDGGDLTVSTTHQFAPDVLTRALIGRGYPIPESARVEISEAGDVALRWEAMIG